MQAIKVTYLNVTATKPRRALARTSSGVKVVVGVDNYDSFEDAARAAAQQLAQDLGWLDDCALVGGTFEDDMYFVLVPSVKPQALATHRDLFSVTRDGVLVVSGLVGEAGVLAWFHKNCTQSQSWMCEHEGYAVIPQVIAPK